MFWNKKSQSRVSARAQRPDLNYDSDIQELKDDHRSMISLHNDLVRHVNVLENDIRSLKFKHDPGYIKGIKDSLEEIKEKIETL